MTHVKWMLLPLFLHVLLITYVGIELLQRRVRSISSGESKLDEVATNPLAWPPRVRKFSQNFINQFETPMLWYGVCAIAVALAQVDLVLVLLSWLFLISRIAHSVVQTGRNHINRRLTVFLVGFAAVFLMWLWLGLKLFLFSALS